MPGTAEYVKAINDIHKSINTGFDTIHHKIDAKFDNCDGRVTQIEREIAVRKAICKKEKENNKRRIDYWKPVIRAVTIAGTLALLGIAGKLLIFGLSL